MLDNRLETALLYWACQWAGRWRCRSRGALSDDELAYCIADCGAQRVVRDGDDLPDGPEHPGALDRDEDDVSLMLYTSGTTGRPKGVPRSHRADRAGGWSQALQHGYLWRERTLGVMPLYHTMGIHSLLAMHLVGGCFVPQARWDAAEALRLVEAERITSLYLAPTLFHDLVHHPDLAERDVSSVRALGYAGAAMTSTLVRRCAEVFEPEVFVNHYGSTEIYTFSIGRDQRAKPGCAGRPAVNTRLRLDETGEICVDLVGDEAFTGYWNRPDADARALVDGWYRTGDTGHLDEDGDLWIDGRVDDMIISGGENVHPLEVEDVLAGHPASTRSRWSARRTTAGASASWPTSSGTRPRRSSTPTASPRRSRASSGRASTASSMLLPKSALGEDPAESAARPVTVPRCRCVATAPTTCFDEEAHA